MPDGLIILPSPGCRRSRRVLDYVRQRGIPHRVIPIESDEGQRLRKEFDLRASPGLLVRGASLNPFEVLDKGKCRVNEAAFQQKILNLLDN